jgi:hypothetical protein
VVLLLPSLHRRVKLRRGRAVRRRPPGLPKKQGDRLPWPRSPRYDPTPVHP